MLISLLNNDKFAYINLHAEQSFRELHSLYSSYTDIINDIEHPSNITNNITQNNNINNFEVGIYCSALKIGVLNELEKDLERIKLKKLNGAFNCIIMDFRGIKQIQPNLETPFKKFFSNIISLNLDIILLNLDIALLKDIQNYTNNFICDKPEQDYKQEFIWIIRANGTTENYIDYFIDSNAFLDNMFDDLFIEEIKKCSQHNLQSLESSPIYTSKYINIKDCINNCEFFPFAIYKLALKIIDNKIITKDLKSNSKTALFCHTINGSYIASLLSNLLCIDLTFFDRIGPTSRLCNTFLDTKIVKNKSYIVATDVICLGSELRSVKTLLDYAGAKFKTAVSIVNCKTVANPSKDTIYSLLEIDKTNNPLEYYIGTDLDNAEWRNEFETLRNTTLI